MSTDGRRGTDPLAALRVAVEQALAENGPVSPLKPAIVGNGMTKLIHWAPRLALADATYRLLGIAGFHTIAGTIHRVYQWHDDASSTAPDILCNGITAWLQATHSRRIDTTELPRADESAVLARRPAAAAWTNAAPGTSSPALTALLAHYASNRAQFLAVATEPVRNAIIKTVDQTDPHDQTWGLRLERLCHYVTAAHEVMDDRAQRTFHTLVGDGMPVLQAAGVALALGDG